MSGTNKSFVKLSVVFVALMGVIPLSGSATMQGVISDDLVIPDRREFKVSPTVDPCEDFYQYACGEELNQFELPVDKSRWTFAFSDSDERIKRAKKSYLQSLSEAKDLKPQVRQMADTYNACMNLSQQKKDEINQMAEVKKEIEGLKDRKALLNYLSRNITRPLRFSFVSFGDINNLDNPLYNDMYIDVDFMALPHRNYYDDQEIAADYASLVDAFFKIYYPQQQEKWGQRFFEFEKAFAQVYPLPEEWRDLETERNMISQKQLYSNYPNLKLAHLVNKIDDRILVRNFTPDSYAFVDKALAEYPLDFLKAFVAYKTLSSMIDESYPEYFQQKFDFQNKHLGGPAVRASLEKRCTSLVTERFGKEMDYELIEILFPNFNKERFLSVLQRVKQSIISGLESNQWLSADSKQGALEKMAKLEFQVVKPEDIKDWDFQDVRYYNPKSSIENTAIFTAMKVKKILKKIEEENRKTIWGMSPLTVNAYYSPSENKFVMPMGILQAPFYDESLSDEANFGAVGVVVGHEIGHGLDDQGAQYDGDGKLRQWMSDEDIAKFKQRGEGLGRFYSEYGMNPDLTMGENIGDLTGLQFSYNAAFPNGQGSSENKRAFFVQYGRAWCQKILPKEYERLVKTDPHSQLPARVNAPVPHIDGFYEAFQCKAGQKMFVPKEERVVIW